MKTISFRIKMTDKIQKVISEDSRIYSSIYRFAYNRFKDGLSGKEVYAKVSESLLKYRFQLNPLNAVFRKRNRKSYVKFLTFFNKV